MLINYSWILSCYYQETSFIFLNLCHICIHNGIAVSEARNTASFLNRVIFYQSVFVCDSLPVVHNQLQSLNTNLEKVNGHNVPVKADTLCLSASAAAAPHCISPVSRGAVCNQVRKYHRDTEGKEKEEAQAAMLHFCLPFSSLNCKSEEGHTKTAQQVREERKNLV